MSLIPGCIPIDFFLPDFECFLRLQIDAETFSLISTPIASFIIEGTVELSLLKNTFLFSVDDVENVFQTQNYQNINFIIDSRPWINYNPQSISNYPAKDYYLCISDFTTAPNSTTLSIWLNWLMYKVKHMKNLIRLVKNVSDIGNNMDNIYKNYVWKQFIYHKLWAQDLFKPAMYNSNRQAITPTPTTDTLTATNTLHACHNTKVKLNGTDINVVALDSNYEPIQLIYENGNTIYKFVTVDDGNGNISFDVDPSNVNATWPNGNPIYSFGDETVTIDKDGNDIYIFDTFGNKILSSYTTHTPVNNIFYSSTSSDNLNKLPNTTYSGIKYQPEDTEVITKSIGQQIFDTMIQRDPERFYTSSSGFRLVPNTILDLSGNPITDMSGNNLNNCYSFPFLLDDTIQYKLNMLVSYDNVKKMFGSSLCPQAIKLNDSLNKADVEHYSYISFLVSLKVVNTV